MPRRSRFSLALAAALVVCLSASALLLPSRARAFCGFYVSGADASLYNDATMVSLMRSGQTTVLTMQNNYQGPPKDFAMVVPVPVVLKKKDVKTVDAGVFDRIDRYSAPRLVEYWERDPCKRPVRRPMPTGRSAIAERSSPQLDGGSDYEQHVKVEAKFKVGEYQVVVLSSDESTALETWLNKNNYNIPKGAAPYLDPYIQNGQYFFVAKVDTKKVKFKKGRAVLSPIRFHYNSKQFALPVRLGLINSKGQQDLIAFLIAKEQRYEVANYPNVTIPTNIPVNEGTKKRFGAFYNGLFDRVMKENPKAVVTEYAWRAGKCDPCPTPPVSKADLMTLGGDVVAPRKRVPVGPRKFDPFGESERRRYKTVRDISPNQWVLTRLHTRYTKKTLGKDLVFKKAPAIVGGRGMPRGEEGTLREREPKQSRLNQFQGRYIIRHFWEGEVKCENPRRGVWGGPRDGGAPPAQGADDLAFSSGSDKPAPLSKFVEEETVPGLKKPVED